MAAGAEIVAMQQAACNQQPYVRRDCPVCSWPLEKHPETGQLHCPFDGWTDGLIIKRGFDCR